MALLSFRGISTPSLPAQGEQRRSFYFNIRRDIPVLFVVIRAHVELEYRSTKTARPTAANA
jgi:hypothetical protein